MPPYNCELSDHKGEKPMATSLLPSIPVYPTRVWQFLFFTPPQELSRIQPALAFHHIWGQRVSFAELTDPKEPNVVMRKGISFRVVFNYNIPNKFKSA